MGLRKGLPCIFVSRQVAGRNDHFRPKDFGTLLCSLDCRYPGQRGCKRSTVNLANLAQIFTTLPMGSSCRDAPTISNPGFPYHGLQLCLASKHQLCGVVLDQCHFSAFCGVEPQLFRIIKTSYFIKQRHSTAIDAEAPSLGGFGLPLQHTPFCRGSSLTELYSQTA